MTIHQLYKTEAEWKKTFNERGAYWRHSGNPNDPHGVLTKGDHSDGFIKWCLIAQYPKLGRFVASDLLKKLEALEGSFSRQFRVRSIQRVVGPETGGILLAHFLAEAVQVRNPECRSGYAEKIPGGMSIENRFDVTGQNILICEDVVTSGGSVSEAITAVEKAGAKVLPVILCVCNRSGLVKIDDRRIISLITEPMHRWDPQDCPLCKKGSEALSPHQGNNWNRLNCTV